MEALMDEMERRMEQVVKCASQHCCKRRRGSSSSSSSSEDSESEDKSSDDEESVLTSSESEDSLLLTDVTHMHARLSHPYTHTHLKFLSVGESVLVATLLGFDASLRFSFCDTSTLAFQDQARKESQTLFQG